MKRSKIIGFTLFAYLSIFLFAQSSATYARQFRQITPIASPTKVNMSLPNGAEPVEQVQDLDRDQVKAAVDEVLSKWNTGGLDSVLSEQFFDKSRLTDAVNTIVPRDATLRVQSVQSIQTLQQYKMPSNGGDSLVSIVSATVQTQLEFNDPTAGFVRRPGVNEFILKVSQPTR